MLFRSRIAEVLRGYTRADLMAKMEELGLPFAPISRPIELFDDPHLNASGGLLAMTLPDGKQTKLPALPISLDGERLKLRRNPPKTGEHDDEIARELGFSEAEIAKMRTSGAIV